MFHADLHIHSKFSRATGRDADLEHMALWARKKGVGVLGTGDFTHPQWMREIREKLVPAEPGLFRLREDLERQVDRDLGTMACSDSDPTRFLLEVEISTIYKKGDKTRKVHHLIYVPDLEAADKLTAKLARIGNLASDGRPILGLDSRHLLEITLESSLHSYLIPAHIWTPWFAVLGSKSGFDHVEECYGDLTPHIFAVETGLSSDPAMNWRLSQLDRYTLVSNSDAHSPPKIGREACAFSCPMDYYAIRQALMTRDGYDGTVEFFPEEGKYHLDGHRTCGVRLDPAETRELGGLCPTCRKPLTIGVLNRIDELADRAETYRPADPQGYRSLVPLPEVLAEIKGVGEASKQVQAAYDDLLAKVGSELFILEEAPVEDLRRNASPLVAEAIDRMRAGRVICEAGYDGEYGVIRVFQPGEIAQRGTKSLLPVEDESRETSVGSKARKSSRKQSSPVRRGSPDATETAGRRSPVFVASQESQESEEGDLRSAPRRGREIRTEQTDGFPEALLDRLDAEQRTAAEQTRGPLLIIAGPGTGKTRTLTHRVAHLVLNEQVPPEHCLTVTFSRRAASELEERLAKLLHERGLFRESAVSREISDSRGRVPVMTFHALGLTILREQASVCGLPADFRIATEQERVQLLRDTCGLTETQAIRAWKRISLHKRPRGNDNALNAEAPAEYETYERLMRERGWVDFDDLILLPVQLLSSHPDLAASYRESWPWVSVDEFQDIDAGQYALLRLLAPPDGNVCVIGDPDQAIYGFRGAAPRVFAQFAGDFPTAKTVSLKKNYRSSSTIVNAALQAIRPSSLVAGRELDAVMEQTELIEIHSCATEHAEAELIVHMVERLLGGSTFFSLDSGRVAAGDGESWSFNDFAVLYRTDSQAEALVEAFARSGIPCQRKSHGPLAEQPAAKAMTQWMLDSQAATLPDEAGSVAERLKRAADAVWTDFPEAATLLVQLHPLADRCGDDLPRFLNELALATDVDLWDLRADRVSLLTLHASKGLEFGVVFLVGCEDGLLPLRFGAAEPDDVDEERRLFFVGMTRARKRLYLTHARRRLRHGQIHDTEVSPFLREIEEELLRRAEQMAKRKQGPTDVQLSLFE